MRITWKREDEMERQLRAQRPEPRHELISEITGAVGRSRARRSGLRARGIAVVLTAAMLVALATTGGLSYAASGVTHAAAAAKHAVAPAKHAKPSTRVGSAQAQYFVAVCFHGETISVDSKAENSLVAAGATHGACNGGSFAPKTKKKRMCIDGHNVLVSRARAKRLAGVDGVSRGFCKVKH
jgi:hypothetical protein